jgi:hypothetical protein
MEPSPRLLLTACSERGMLERRCPRYVYSASAGLSMFSTPVCQSCATAGRENTRDAGPARKTVARGAPVWAVAGGARAALRPPLASRKLQPLAVSMLPDRNPTGRGRRRHRGGGPQLRFLRSELRTGVRGGNRSHKSFRGWNTCSGPVHFTCSSPVLPLMRRNRPLAERDWVCRTLPCMILPVRRENWRGRGKVWAAPGAAVVPTTGGERID